MTSGDEVLRTFAGDLRLLREKAGGPTYRQLSASAHYSAAALSEAASGRRLPTLAVTLAYVAACGGDVAAWEARWRELAVRVLPAGGERRPDDTEAPYVGLAAFQVGDAERFFGRRTLTEELLAGVGNHRFLGVFGASGSGKSSVLRAGLAARLDRAEPVIITPGPHPIEECAIRLAGVLGESPAVLRAEFAADPGNLHLRIRKFMADRPPEVDLVLIVDQFEEIFTRCDDDAERRWLIDALVHAAFAPTSRTRVVLGVRADFYGYCGQHPELVSALRDATVLVGPMTVDELRETITEPAARGGCRVETAFVARLVSDATGQPAALPLVSHVLLETWRHRRGTTLTLTGYELVGGVQHALSRTAEQVFDRLGGDEQRTARQIFLRLTTLGEGVEDAKRRAGYAELNCDPNTATVLDILAQARLITLDQHGIELTHEALIRHWPRLRNWLTEDRDGLRVHRALTDAAGTWESLHRDPGALFRGTRLDHTSEWASTPDAVLTQQERDFLDASRAVHAAEQEAARRRACRVRHLVTLLVVLLVLACAATTFAALTQRTASEQRNVGLAQKVLGEAAALRDTQPALALQLALAAYRLDPGKPARDALQAMSATPYATRLGQPDAVLGVAVSSDGHLLATADLDRIRVTDISDPHQPRVLPTTTSAGVAASVAFSPTLPILASTDIDGTPLLWDLADGTNLRTLTAPAAHRPDTPAGIGTSVAFRPDGRVLATAGSDRTVRLWDLTDPTHPRLLATPPARPDSGDDPGIGASVAFSPDGRTLAATARDHTARLWDVTDLRSPAPLATLAGHTGPVLAVAFSPDGRTVATAGRDRTAMLWDLGDRRNPVLLARLTGHTGPVDAVAFSRDGHTLATASQDRTARLWNLDDPRAPALTTLTGHTDTVYAVAFSPDDRLLVTGSDDRTARLTDLAGLTLARHTDQITAIATSRTGNLVATASADRTIRLWDLSDPDRPRAGAVIASGTEQTTLSLSDDGRFLAAGDGTTVRVWDIRRPVDGHTIVSGSTGVARARFLPGGHILATSRLAHRTELLDVSDPDSPLSVGGVPAALVAVGGNGHAIDDAMMLWNLADPGDPRPAGTVTADGDERPAAFGRDGHLLALVSHSKETVRLLDTTDPRHPTRLATISVDADQVAAVAFDDAGKRLVTSGANQTARVWDITDPHNPTEETTLSGHAATVSAAAFVPGGRLLLTGDRDHLIHLWRTDTEQLAARICGVAYPRLTRTEWDRYFADLGYLPPC